MKIFRGLLILLCCFFVGCLPVRPNTTPPTITQLQTRAIQTRSYDGYDQKTVLKTVLNVLQDEGFLVSYGDSELGLLNASKQLVEYNPNNYSSMFAGITGQNDLFAVSTIDATANISNYGNQIKVRMNFQRKIQQNIIDNDLLYVNAITDPKYYQEFFVKVDKGLYINKQGLE